MDCRNCLLHRRDLGDARVLAAALAAQAKISDCTIFRNEGAGIVFGASTQMMISGSTVSENTFGMGLGDPAQAVIEGNKVIRNEAYGVVLYQRPCFDTGRVFSGYVSGKGNIILGPKEPDGNDVGVICPQELSFLVSAQGGELDQRK